MKITIALESPEVVTAVCEYIKQKQPELTKGRVVKVKASPPTIEVIIEEQPVRLGDD